VFTLQVQGTQIGQATGSINWNAAQTMAVHPVEHMPEPTMPSMQPMEPMPPMETMQPMRPMEPIQPMQPLQPMRMGNMEMSANPMEMRMGNMEMRMGNQAEPQAPKRRFCTQCGAAVDQMTGSVVAAVIGWSDGQGSIPAGSSPAGWINGWLGSEVPM
jgi:hypothetical protein